MLSVMPPSTPQLTEEQQRELQEKLKNLTPEQLRELQKQQCIFCQIVSGKIPAKKIYEDEKTVVVLDINPAAKGHVLVLPREHYAILPHVPPEEIGHLFAVAKAMSHLFLKNLNATGSTVFIANGAIAGQRAPHFMIHVIPRKETDNLIPMEEKLVTPELQEKVVNLLKERLTPGFAPSQVPELAPTSELFSEQLPSELSEDGLSEEAEESQDLKVEEKEELEKKVKKIPKQLPKRKREEKSDEAGASLDDIARLFK